jgi:hypothetical protein
MAINTYSLRLGNIGCDCTLIIRTIHQIVLKNDSLTALQYAVALTNITTRAKSSVIASLLPSYFYIFANIIVIIGTV